MRFFLAFTVLSLTSSALAIPVAAGSRLALRGNDDYDDNRNSVPSQVGAAADVIVPMVKQFINRIVPNDGSPIVNPIELPKNPVPDTPLIPDDQTPQNPRPNQFPNLSIPNPDN